ncbi:methyltransferase domain-containing protein [Pseudolysinimonas sp.]|uniref:methyltransferase domain-containing protein n=1 Tax=Pseudolysinimonas sp. TaxID=2680009 RepID=UPI0037840977
MSDRLVARLRAVGCVFAEAEAAEIRRVLGHDDDATDAVVAARAAGTPLEQALGVARFAGVEVEVGDGVFVPRLRAEPLVDDAVAAAPDARVVVDLGCGSGAIAAALHRRLPQARVHAVDIDPVALRFAARNGRRHGFEAHLGDWWQALPRTLRGRVDLAVAYLPHVPTARLSGIAGDYRAHEPDRAVAGGADGLDPLRAVVAGMDDWMSPDGLLVTFVADEQHIAARTVAGARRVLFVLG